MRKAVNKVVSLDELAELVPEGSLIGLGGAWLSNHPMAAMRQLLRDEVGNLHLAETMGSMDIDMMVGAGLVSKVTFSMVSLEAFGLPPHFRRAVQSGEIEITELSGLALNTAFEAASRNIPFLPMASLGLSEFPARQPDWYAKVDDPFTGIDLLAVKALAPDVAILHARRASAEGDCQFDGPMAIDPEMSRSAKRLIVTCEEIVSRETVEATPHMTKVPGFLVDAVIEAPFGAHPLTHVPLYGLDAWELRDYAAAAADPAAWPAYLERLRRESEDEYRDRTLPPDRRRVIRNLARAGEPLGEGAR
jgi:glutaconate CoA-transferase subunit A